MMLFCNLFIEQSLYMTASGCMHVDNNPWIVILGLIF